MNSRGREANARQRESNSGGSGLTARLRRRVWLSYAAGIGVYLPGVIALMVALVAGTHAGPLVQWCQDYWWAMLVAGAMAYFPVVFAASWLVRCPHCRFRLQRAMPVLVLLQIGSIVRFCPHCGVGFDALVAVPGADRSRE